MKILLLTIFLSLNIFAASVSSVQESIVELSSHINTNIGLALSLFIGLLIGLLLFKKLDKNKRDALSQNIIRDLEDEQTNLINQINYIETQNENQISYIETQNEKQDQELKKKILHVEKENEILIGKNQELINQMEMLKDSHLILYEELNKRANKATEEKNTLFRQVEETIIFDIPK